jgi:hypothetical protein
MMMFADTKHKQEMRKVSPIPFQAFSAASTYALAVPNSK